jgi:hypothetical protein
MMEQIVMTPAEDAELTNRDYVSELQYIDKAVSFSKGDIVYVRECVCTVDPDDNRTYRFYGYNLSGRYVSKEATFGEFSLMKLTFEEFKILQREM